MTAPALHGIARTLLVPLACRALESIRPDTIFQDPRAVEVYNALGGDRDFLMGMSRIDQTFTVMRARQFDSYARLFLDAHPGGLVVDIGCGLDTRYDRLDNGRMIWLGLDLPEVVDMRRQLLPDTDRCLTIAQSMLELTWLDAIARFDRPTIFLEEGVFPYFTESQVKSIISALAERFPAAELVFDALSSFSVKLHNRTHPVLKDTGARLQWGVDDPHALESWGLRLLDKWGYFDAHEPRLGLANLIRYIPVLANTNFILHYRLEGPPGKE